MDLMQKAQGIKILLEDTFLNEAVINNKEPDGSWRTAKMSGVVIPDPNTCDITDPNEWSVDFSVIEPPTGEMLSRDLLKSLPPLSVKRIFHSNFNP